MNNKINKLESMFESVIIDIKCAASKVQDTSMFALFISLLFSVIIILGTIIAFAATAIVFAFCAFIIWSILSYIFKELIELFKNF